MQEKKRIEKKGPEIRLNNKEYTDIYVIYYRNNKTEQLPDGCLK